MPRSSSTKANYKYIPVVKLRIDPANPRFFGSAREREAPRSRITSRSGSMILNTRYQSQPRHRLYG